MKRNSYESGTVTDKPEQTLFCAAREMIYAQVSRALCGNLPPVDESRRRDSVAHVAKHLWRLVVGLGEWLASCSGRRYDQTTGNTLLSALVVGVLTMTTLCAVQQCSAQQFKTNSVESEILHGDSRDWKNLKWLDLTNIISPHQTTNFVFLTSITNSMFGDGWAEFNFSNHFDYYRKMPTNIVIKTNYTGTIQVGTNYYHVDELISRSHQPLPPKEILEAYSGAAFWTGASAADEFAVNLLKGTKSTNSIRGVSFERMVFTNFFQKHFGENP